MSEFQGETASSLKKEDEHLLKLVDEALAEFDAVAEESEKEKEKQEKLSEEVKDVESKWPDQDEVLERAKETVSIVAKSIGQEHPLVRAALKVALKDLIISPDPKRVEEVIKEFEKVISELHTQLRLIERNEEYIWAVGGEPEHGVYLANLEEHGVTVYDSRSQSNDDEEDFMGSATRHLNAFRSKVLKLLGPDNSYQDESLKPH